VSGRLHEETNYGATDKQGLLVFRKKLEDLTLPMIDKIVDPVVREIVKDRLTEKGIDLAGSGKPPKEAWKKPLYMRMTKSDKQVQIKKVRIYNVAENVIGMRDYSGRPYRYVEPGSNHHIEIFEYTDTKGKVKREGRVIPMCDAVHRSQRGEPVVNRNFGHDKKFICSLAINEMFMIDTGGGSKELYRVQKIVSNKQIFFRQHTFGGELKKSKGISKYPNSLRGYKVAVDPLGRIWQAND
jgi:CRISPR-associated endonuclease Csn1